MNHAQNNSELSNAEMNIDVAESWDVNFWCEELSLRADDLKDIVRQVGPSVHEVRMHLAKNLLINWPASY